MAYTINLTNGAIFATIPDGTRDTSSSLVIIGKNYEGYGEFIGENFVKTLENHANTSAPTNPLTGQLWYDLTESNIKVYNGTLFKTLGATVTQLDEPAIATSVTGDIWYDTTTQQVKVYNGSIYELVGPLYTVTTGKTGPIVETLVDTGANEHVATVHYVEGEVLSISHKDTAFALQTPISGFAGIIYPGTQLSTDVAGETPQFTGTATNAELLDNVDSTGYLSALDPDTTAGTLGVLHDDGLSVGADSDLQVSITGADAFITNNTTDGRLVLRANPLGVTKDVITIATVADKAYARVTEVPVAGADIANMTYVDTKVAIDGTDTMTGNLDLGTNRAVNVADPVDLQDAATKNYVLNQLLGIIYQVGSYFLGPNPNGTIPGTWAQLPSGTFLMASASGNGSTGGANTKALSIANMPSHNHGGGSHRHTYTYSGDYSPTDIGIMGYGAAPRGIMPNTWGTRYTSYSGAIVAYQGSGSSWDSRPQYEEVEVWKRTA